MKINQLSNFNTSFTAVNKFIGCETDLKNITNNIKEIAPTRDLINHGNWIQLGLKEEPSHQKAIFRNDMVIINSNSSDCSESCDNTCIIFTEKDAKMIIEDIYTLRSQESCCLGNPEAKKTLISIFWEALNNYIERTVSDKNTFDASKVSEEISKGVFDYSSLI